MKVKLKFRPPKSDYDVMCMQSILRFDPDRLSEDVGRAFAEVPSCVEVRTHLGAITRAEFKAQTKGLPKG